MAKALLGPLPGNLWIGNSSGFGIQRQPAALRAAPRGGSRRKGMLPAPVRRIVTRCPALGPRDGGQGINKVCTSVLLVEVTGVA